MTCQHRQAALRLHQQIVSLHVGVAAGFAIAGNIDGYEPGVASAQFLGVEASARGRPGRQILNKDIGMLKNRPQQRGVL